MGSLLSLEVPHLCCYLLLALVMSLAVRILTSLVERWHRGAGWFWPVFLGFGKDAEAECDTCANKKTKRVAADRLTGLVLGIAEAIFYPLLFKAGLPLFVGAWLAFKTADRWNYKSQDRGLFNRYLAANALMLIYGFVMARYWPWPAT